MCSGFRDPKVPNKKAQVFLATAESPKGPPIIEVGIGFIFDKC